ncbi:MAG: glycine betaine ABC transporter substrate-binding protein [Syntrophobacteraceae bacterium]|nr:glycine betaine ABC transporter substrate-binding protein [Syntrophobacteraceae bacterium]
MKYALPLLALLSLLAVEMGAPPPALGSSPEVVIGSKTFIESVLLAEMAALIARSAGARVVDRKGLGGTRVLWDALLKGDIDLYPEYTGTISQEIFAGKGIHGEKAIRAALGRLGIRMTPSLGFTDNYALGMKRQTCKKLGLFRISDLRGHPGLIFGFSSEFMNREDGWPGLRDRYDLPQKNVFGMEHDLAYRGLASGSIDATDVYTTDAEIAYYDLCTLEDDLHYFPAYKAVFLYRRELEKRAPRFIAALESLDGKISAPEMIELNELAKFKKAPEIGIAARFLAKRLSIESRVRVETVAQRVWKYTKEHLYLVSISLCAAILVSLPLGIIAEKWRYPGQVILAVVGIIQTIPAMALLVFMIPLLGIGGLPAIAALFLYSLLPIVRNTYAGLHEVPRDIRESAEALGLPPGARLMLVELPMASGIILNGIKTSAVINVGTATLGALIGAGGYGQPILTGIRLDDLGLILQGAVPAAFLALLVQALFGLAEFLLIPKGLRLKATR